MLTHPYIKAFLLALSLLTRLPIPNLTELRPDDHGRSTLFYPLTGLIIGLLLCLPIFIFPNASPLLVAAVITVIWAVITGGLHLDGLADSTDGWLGGLGDPNKTHKIMKDPLVGAAGVIAIVCVLLLKFAALTTLLLQDYWIIILLAPLLGRSMILLLFLTTRTTTLLSKNARENSMAISVIDAMPKKVAAIVMGIGCLILVSFSLWGIAFTLICFFLLRRMMIKRLGGCTGDTTGAVVEMTEMSWLLGTALML